MSGKIEISLELAEQALRFLMSPGDGWEAGQIAQELRALLEKSDDADKVSNRQMGLMQFVDKHASPVVERQEPAADIVEAIDPNNGHIRRRGLHWHSVETLRETLDFKEWIGGNVTKEQPLYTSPPAPVAVVLDERAEFENYYRDRIMGNRTGVRFLRSASGSYLDSEVREMWSGWQARACLDKVKELNQ